MRDSAGFDEFYLAHVQRVTGQVYALTGDLPETQDCVAEAFVKAWQRWSEVSQHANPAAWVRTVATRIAIGRWRRFQHGLRLAGRHRQPQAVPGPSPDLVALVDALRSLPEDQRIVIVLHHLHDLTVEDVAQLTCSKLGTVKSRLSRGRCALAGLLSDDLPDVPRADEAEKVEINGG